MTSVFRLYGKLLQPWITAAAYFWILVDYSARLCALVVNWAVVVTVQLPWRSIAVSSMRILNRSKLALIACLPIASWLLSPADAAPTSIPALRECWNVVPDFECHTFGRVWCFPYSRTVVASL